MGIVWLLACYGAFVISRITQGARAGSGAVDVALFSVNFTIVTAIGSVCIAWELIGTERIVITDDAVAREWSMGPFGYRWQISRNAVARMEVVVVKTARGWNLGRAVTVFAGGKRRRLTPPLDEESCIRVLTELRDAALPVEGA